VIVSIAVALFYNLELDAAVALAAFGCCIRGNWLVGSESFWDKTAFVYSVLNEVVVY